MNNLAVLARGTFALGITLVLACSTKPYNTRAIGVSADGGTDAGGRSMPNANGNGNGNGNGSGQKPIEGPQCPTESPTILKSVGQACPAQSSAPPAPARAGSAVPGPPAPSCVPLGAECELAADCQSGFCADGVCCNVACTGACVSCNQSDQMGECVPVPAGGEDPHNVCRKDSPETCGQSGFCNGQGGCAKYAAGTTCELSSCDGREKFVPASLCDGEGTCVWAWASPASLDLRVRAPAGTAAPTPRSA